MSPGRVNVCNCVGKYPAGHYVTGLRMQWEDKIITFKGAPHTY